MPGDPPDDTSGAMPAEWREHAGTIMAWPARQDVWGPLLPGVRRDIERIARTIAEHEPLTLLARPEQAGEVRRRLGTGVEVQPCPLDDLWTRDTGPVFVAHDRQLSGVDLNFNGWGGKQQRGADAGVARAVLEHRGVPRVRAGITGEGGSIEVDGEGTALVTESSLVNDNRNPGRSRAEIDTTLRELFGLREVIWLAGVRGLDITDCHVDALARFAGPGVVLLSGPSQDTPRPWVRVHDQARQVLRNARDAAGRALRVVELPEADPREIGPHGEEFLTSYANYYTVNGAVLVPRFGDRKADDRAQGILRELHPGRKVVALPIDTLAEGGGGIHCATQQIPRA